tara:strand:+ start:522 stop:929 length:408 start_codon:yes stop_codon:yes gene_type:complete
MEETQAALVEAIMVMVAVLAVQEVVDTVVEAEEPEVIQPLAGQAALLEVRMVAVQEGAIITFIPDLLPLLDKEVEEVLPIQEEKVPPVLQALRLLVLEALALLPQDQFMEGPEEEDKCLLTTLEPIMPRVAFGVQ